MVLESFSVRYLISPSPSPKQANLSAWFPGGLFSSNRRNTRSSRRSIHILLRRRSSSKERQDYFTIYVSSTVSIVVLCFERSVVFLPGTQASTIFLFLDNNRLWLLLRIALRRIVHLGGSLLVVTALRRAIAVEDEMSVPRLKDADWETSAVGRREEQLGLAEVLLLHLLCSLMRERWICGASKHRRSHESWIERWKSGQLTLAEGIEDHPGSILGWTC